MSHANTGTPQLHAGWTSHQRIVWIDIVRVVAIVSVVLIHASEASLQWTLHTNTAKNGVLFGRVLLALFTGIGRIGVPLFLMITGFLMLGRDYSGERLKRYFLRNFLPLLASFEIWNLITFLVLRTGNGEIRISVKQWIFSSLLVGKEIDAPLWYMRMIIVFYVLIPLISYFIKKIGKTWVDLLCLLGFMCFSVIPTIILLSPFDDGSGLSKVRKLLSYGSYPLLMLIGYALKTRTTTPPKNMGAMAVLTSLSVIGTAAITYMQWDSGNEFGMGYFLVTSIVAAVCGFRWISGINLIHGNSVRRGITVMSVSSYGIYLVHHPIMELLANMFSNTSMPINVFLFFVVAPLLSFLLIQLLSRIRWCRIWMLQMH